MSDLYVNGVHAVSPLEGALRVQPVRPEREVAGGDSAIGRHASGVAAVTGGNLRAATAQLVLDPQSQGVVIRVSDATTNKVIGELGSAEVEAMTNDMKRYVAAAVAAGKRS